MPKNCAKKYERGHNPASLENLKARPPIYPENKKIRRCTVTDSGWQGCKSIADELGLSGVSELLELIGRSGLTVSKSN